MFLLTKPSDAQVRQFISSQHDKPFSYSEPADRSATPSGYVVDRNRIELGRGAEAFARAAGALKRWEMFELGWIELMWPDAPIEVGTNVAVLARHLGFWSLNACRIARVIDEDGPVRKYGFVYGTLVAHAERGYEQFMIEWSRESDVVAYEIYANSRPNHPLVWLGYPITRAFQKRFARDSKQAMLRAVNGV